MTPHPDTIRALIGAVRHDPGLLDEFGPVLDADTAARAAARDDRDPGGWAAGYADAEAEMLARFLIGRITERQERAA